MGDGNVLVGHGAHRKDDEGFVDRQAVIVAVVGDAALLEFFDWVVGAPALSGAGSDKRIGDWEVGFVRGC